MRCGSTADASYVAAGRRRDDVLKPVLVRIARALANTFRAIDGDLVTRCVSAASSKTTSAAIDVPSPPRLHDRHQRGIGSPARPTANASVIAASMSTWRLIEA